MTQTVNGANPLQQAAAQAITTALTGDLRHPDRPKTPLIFPGLQAAGHPDPQIVDAIQQTARMLGEALIHTVLTKLDAQLIPNTDLDALRTRAHNAKPATVTLRCKHRDLLKIAVKPGSSTADIRCDRLRAHLTECENG